MTLTRSKAKHPPAKTVNEARKIKSKVDNSNRKQRSNMTDWRQQRLAEMDREIEKGTPSGVLLPATEKENTMNMTERLDALERKFDADELRLSAERDQRTANEIDAKAQHLMESDPTLDYSTATKMALANDERFTSTADTADQGTDLAEAVERRMDADPEHYGDEAVDDEPVGNVHAMSDDADEPVGSVHAMSNADYEQQVKEAMKNRGYDLD